MTDHDLNKHLDEIAEQEREYERVCREYRHELEMRWPQTEEGYAAIAEMIADQADNIAKLLCSGDWKAESAELKSAVNRVIDNAVEDIIQNAAISRVIDICENTPRQVTLDDLQAAQVALSNVQ